jgi:hypothetical protein
MQHGKPRFHLCLVVREASDDVDALAELAAAELLGGEVCHSDGVARDELESDGLSALQAAPEDEVDRRLAEWERQRQ